MKLKMILPLVLVSFCLPAQEAWACEPHPDYWFAETVTLDAAGLPPGFYLYAAQSGSAENLPEGVWLFANNTANAARSTIYIVNRTPTPLYIMSLQYRDRLVMETPDPDWKTRLSMAHEVASYLVRPDLGEALLLDLAALRDLDASLSDPNVSSYNPPASDALLPDPQRSELLLVWGEQVVVAPFTITYQINQHYNNGGCQEWWDSQNTTEAARYAATQAAQSAELQRKLILIATGFVMGAVVIVWRSWRRRTPSDE
jgi:hypothetical protein